MISVRLSPEAVLVQERGVSALMISAGLFCVLGALTLLEPALTPQHAVSTGLLFAAGAACAIAGTRSRYLCRLPREPAPNRTQQITVRWNTQIDSRLSVHAGSADGELFGSNRVSQVLFAAEQLAQSLGARLVVVPPSATSRDDRADPEEPALHPARGAYVLPPSGAHRRAELACRAVGVLLAVQMAFLTLSTMPKLESLHPLSLILATAAPASVLLVALALSSRQPLVRIADDVAVEYYFLGRCWRRSRLDPSQTRCTLLQHPRLDLGFVWLHSPHHSIVISSNARAAAGLVTLLSKHRKPSSQ